MIVLRTTLLIGALVATIAPAAAFGGGTSPQGSPVAELAAAKLRAVEAAVEAAKPHGGAIDRNVEKGVQAFYEGRAYLPLWFKGGDFAAQAVALRRRMDQAAEYGLDPAAYATPLFAERTYGNPEELGEADVEFSNAVARFVTHVASGRINPTDISPLITLEPERPEAGDILNTLARAPSVGMALSRFEPSHPQYRALKTKLAALQALGKEEERIVVPEGALLRPGKSDARVLLLRQRLETELPEETDSELYDDALVEAVKGFQEANGLGVDGIVGPSTLLALNGRSREDDIASIVANLERWRWMPRDLGQFHVIVNVPEFLVRVVDDGTVVHEARVIVGKPTNPTPTFSNSMSHLVVNPYWNVPVSILRKEMMPEIRANPHGYFARHGYEVLANIGGRMRQIQPASVDWGMVNPRSLRVRQVPGAGNALGRIKFMFPNQHSVYLHDTPTKPLFARDRRAFSHGCVRVQDPLDFADAILPVAAPKWNSARIESLFGGKERRVNLEHPVPVHLAYFTTSVGPDGELRSFEDIYGYDTKMTEFLGF